MTDSYILEKVFRKITGLKFETLLLSSDCLSLRKTDAIFALSGKTPLEIQLFIASANSWESTSADILTSLGGILSVPLAFLSPIFLRKLINFRSGYIIKWKLFYSLWIVQILPYFKHVRMIIKILHCFVNDHVIFQWICAQNKGARFLSEWFFHYNYIVVIKCFY